MRARDARSASSRSSRSTRPERAARSRASATPDARARALCAQLGGGLTFPSESLCGSGSRYVDDFEQLAQIGEGSFGTVFKCRKRVDGCLYAVKVTRKQMRSEAQRQGMLREVFALSSFSQSARKESTHIVRYFNAWWDDGRLYIQTELCLHSLSDVIERARGPLPSELCTTVLEQCLRGLSLIHSNSMCHLDIKVRAAKRGHIASRRAAPS